MSQKYKYIDLFAGCGGLSLGLRSSGFKQMLAVEKSYMAAETFFHNHIERINNTFTWEKFSSSETSILEQANKGLIVRTLEEVLSCKELMNSLRGEDIDLVAGGPPCQGFSTAGRRDPQDVRNKLVWQFLDFVSAVNPKAVLIENVAGMQHGFKKYGLEATFNQLVAALNKTGFGYIVQPMLLNAMHYGVPQYRPRIMLVALRQDVAKRANARFSPETWQSGAIIGRELPLAFPAHPTLAPLPATPDEPCLTVRDAIYDLQGGAYELASNCLPEYAITMRNQIVDVPGEEFYKTHTKGIRNHEIRDHSYKVKKRFRLYQVLSKYRIPLDVITTPLNDTISKSDRLIRINNKISNAQYPLISPDGTLIAKGKEELIDLIFELATKKHSQRPLRWDAPSHTVLSLPDDYIHPSEPRTMTVRELARFQSFPDSFEFRAKVTTGGKSRRDDVPQYTQVGNAVPPLLGKAIGQSIMKALSSAYSINDSYVFSNTEDGLYYNEII